jgi:CheY-like chemotaxis protein
MHRQIRCYSCGSRSDVNLSDSEERALRIDGAVYRFCGECHGQTKWMVQESGAPSRVADADLAGELGGKVLLIDDDEDILIVLGKVLRREKLDLDVASSAREALQKVVRGDYDLILSDIRMPDFDGKQLFKFLEEHLPEARSRVVFLTGDSGNPETQKFLEEAQAPYLTKPIDISALVTLVRQVLYKE